MCLSNIRMLKSYTPTPKDGGIRRLGPLGGGFMSDITALRKTTELPETQWTRKYI